MRNDNCIFCKIAAGQIPSNTVYEDEDFRVILDIAPASKGHAIVLPKEHMADLLSADSNVTAKALPVIKKVANAIKTATGCEGVNILQNNGEAAGQTVFHLHFHIIPRVKGDNVIPSWNTLSYAENEAATIAENIRKEL